MTPIEPGQEFTIEYGNGHRLKVKALSLRQRRDLVRIVESVQQVQNKSELFDAVEAGLNLCLPNDAERLLDTIDEAMGMQIIIAVLSTTAVDDDQKKESGLPLSLDAANSARAAYINARTLPVGSR